MKKSEVNETEVALIAKDVVYIKADVKEIKEKLEVGYITRVEFEPIKKVVYGVVTLILIAVVGGLLTLVVKQ